MNILFIYEKNNNGDFMKNNNFILYILFGFFIISIISLNSADNININVSNIVNKQIIWYIVGFLIMYLFIKVDLTFLYKNIWIFYLIFSFLLLTLLFYGPIINNARCWFKIPGIGTIQISEFMKVVLLLKFSSFFANTKNKNLFYVFVFSIIIILIPSILTFLEPDTGAVIMYFIILFSMIIYKGVRKKWLITFTILIFLSLTIFIFIYYINNNLFLNIFGTSGFLRVERLTNWINKEGLQLNRSLIAIGIGNITGTGFNNNLIYFPEAHTDFIFTIIASNFGFLGSVILIILILLFDCYLLNIGVKAKRIREKYFVIGSVSLLFYQQIQNIGMTFGLFPITGITLPFISYGGSSLLSYFIILGLILNIKKNQLS